MAEDTAAKLIINGEIWWEYRGKRYPEQCRCGNACAHIADKAGKYCQGIGLDIGAGAFPFRDAFPIRDLVNYSYRDGRQFRREAPLMTGINAHNLSCFLDSSMDYVFSSHCLEHLEKPWDAIRLWVQKIKSDGILFLYLPHPDMELWRPGAPWVKKAHKWVPDYITLAERFVGYGLKIIDGSRDRDNFWSFFIVGRKNG